MSEWYEAKNEDIDVDFNDREVNIFVKQNEFGSIYVSLSFAQVLTLANEIKSLPKPGESR